MGLQAQPAVDTELKARQIDVQRDVKPGPQQHAAQTDIELNGVCSTRRRRTLDPCRQAVAVAVVPAHVHAGGQDVQPARTEDVVQGLPQHLDQFAVAAQFLPQIGKQTGPRITEEIGGCQQLVPDQRDVLRHAAAEHILHRAQSEIHTVQQRGRVVKHVQDIKTATQRRKFLLEVRIAVHDGRTRIRADLAAQLLEQLPQALHAEDRVGLNLQRRLQRVLQAAQGQSQRQPDIEATL